VQACRWQATNPSHEQGLQCGPDLVDACDALTVPKQSKAAPSQQTKSATPSRCSRTSDGARVRFDNLLTKTCRFRIDRTDLAEVRSALERALERQEDVTLASFRTAPIEAPDRRRYRGFSSDDRLIVTLHSWLLRIATSIMLVFVFGAARAETSDVETTWRLLDYIAVDYAGAVSQGQISSHSEYAEQNEFAATVVEKLKALPPKAERQALLAEADRLQQAIRQRADPEQVAEIAHHLAGALLAAYPVPLAPKNVPDLARGAALYGQHCAACHGEAGDGRGPDAAKLDPPPVAFADAERGRQRSVFGLYQVVTQGLDRTAMPSFEGFPLDDRWALAFYAGRFAFSDAAAAEGERLWKQDATLHRLLPDLKTLIGTTPTALAGKIGQDKADAVIAYLRRHPDAVARQDGSLSLVRSRLSQSVDAIRAGDQRRAGELALSAYLDGFEPVEPALSVTNRTLLERIEELMGEYRAALQVGESAEMLSDRVQVIDGLLDDAEAALSPGAGNTASTFLGAATILLREGLEALLIVVAMIAFVRKSERMDVMPYVHGGWVAAIVLGLLTWALATWVIGISGASRELTEGFGSVFAAVVLLSVGIWMHGKAQADDRLGFCSGSLSSWSIGRCSRPSCSMLRFGARAMAAPCLRAA
jgi:high-affinity iron transporter